MRTKKYDLIVLGTGDAGQAVALAAAKEKWKVAIIEKKAIGGTCALWGDVPQKVLISEEELANFSQRMAAAGLSSKTTPDWSELMAFKHRLTSSFSDDFRSRLIEQARTPMDFQRFLAFFRLGLRLVILGRERFEYWQLLLWTLVRKPRQLPLASTLTIYGHHFMRICELYIFQGGRRHHAGNNDTPGY